MLKQCIYYSRLSKYIVLSILTRHTQYTTILTHITTPSHSKITALSIRHKPYRLYISMLYFKYLYNIISQSYLCLATYSILFYAQFRLLPDTVHTCHRNITATRHPNNTATFYPNKIATFYPNDTATFYSNSTAKSIRCINLCLLTVIKHIPLNAHIASFRVMSNILTILIHTSYSILFPVLLKIILV